MLTLHYSKNSTLTKNGRSPAGLIATVFALYLDTPWKVFSYTFAINSRSEDAKVSKLDPKE